MKRRTVVAVSSTMLGTLTAGCSTLAYRKYSFNIYNSSRDDHTFRVKILSTSNEVLYNNTFELDAGSGDEDIQIDGVPARVVVQINSSEESHLPWPASLSEEGKLATPATIHYDQRGQKEIAITG